MSRISVLVGGLLTAACVLSAVPASGAGYDADTKPSEDVTTAFLRPGRIAEVVVEEGDLVEKDTLLVRLDDKAEKLQLEQLRLESENRTHLEAAIKQRDQSEVDYEQMKQMYEKGAATDLEVQHAELDVEIAKLKVHLSEHNLKVAKLKYQEAREQVDRMNLTSPVQGIVEKIVVSEGESVDSLQKIVRVVNIDPLWVEVDVPVSEAVKVEPGDEARVTWYANTQREVTGEVIHRGSVASGAIPPTLRVRVEIPNKEGRPAGEQVIVRFPALEATPGEESPEGEESKPEGPTPLALADDPAEGR